MTAAPSPNSTTPSSAKEPAPVLTPSRAVACPLVRERSTRSLPHAGTQPFTGWKSLRAPRPTVTRRRRRANAAGNLLRISAQGISHPRLWVAAGGAGILANCHVDVVLADYHLGDGMGASLANRLEIYGQRRPPVVLISADISPETRECAMRLGAELFVSKPVPARRAARHRHHGDEPFGGERRAAGAFLRARGKRACRASGARNDRRLRSRR